MNISLSHFFKTKMDEEIVTNKVVCFNGNEYSSHFFSLLLKKLRPNFLSVNFINIQDFDVLNLKLMLEQSFLGSSNFYCLGNISDYKNKKELISYLNTYESPHYIVFFINDEKIDSYFNKLIIKYENPITIDQVNSILTLWPLEKQDMIKIFLKKIFEQTHKLSLDQICIFVNYCFLLGRKHDAFFSEWLSKILINEQSFFTLSKYFFSFDSKSFYNCWNKIEDYPTVFWTTYWSEQLYRAYYFISFRQEDKNLQAKQIAYKLPFSFMQNDWKKTSLNELKSAHQFIYDLDYCLKNGASDFSLDLFYAKFFAREFSRIN